MRKFLGILFIGVLLTGCSGSRGCGCPSWGAVETIQDQPIVVQHTALEEMKNVMQAKSKKNLSFHVHTSQSWI